MRDCDKCEGGGILWIPVGEFGERSALCWKCGGSGTPAALKPQPTDS
jgi:hypothetical protein